MARGEIAKKDSLTIEERLKQALVPNWEQPYKVPENWVWTRLNSLIVLISGRDAALSACNDQRIGIPYILGASNLNDTGFSVERWIEIPQVISKKNDILLSVKGTIGKLYLQTEHEINISRQIMAIRPLPHMNLSMMFLYLTHICQELKEAGNGLIPGISRSDILNKEIPLPPLAEQQRIVDRIESLFAKLDEAKEKAQTALDSFETRKAAVLHKAFTGELTQKWREENGLGLDSWEDNTSSNIFSYVTSGSRGWSQYYSNSGAVFIRMGNLDHGTVKIDYSDIQYVDLPDKAEGQRSLVQQNDILVSITADVGMVGIVEDDSIEAYINQHVALARPVTTVNAHFIAWFFVSDLGLAQLKNLERGATKKGLTLQDLRSLQILLPTLPEQNEIVRILDSLFTKEEKAKEIGNVIGKIDLMKKAILARAFRGKLGTNDPNEENAIGLLKNIIWEKIDSDVISVDKGHVVEQIKIQKQERIAMAKTIMEALHEYKELTPEKLKALTELDVDDFYDKLKELVEGGQVVERREGGESFLEVVHES